jgi:hypothetical protein
MTDKSASEYNGAPTTLDNEEASFLFSATLRIYGDELDFEEIEGRLGLQATTKHRRGERRSVHFEYKHDTWQYTAPVSRDRPMSVHIDTLWEKIKHQSEYLRALKARATVDVFLSYRSTVDHAGFEIPCSSLELFVTLRIPFGISVIIA